MDSIFSRPFKLTVEGSLNLQNMVYLIDTMRTHPFKDNKTSIPFMCPVRNTLFGIPINYIK